MTALLSIPAAAAELGVCPATVRRWIRDGQLAAFGDKRLYVPRAALEARLNHGPTAPPSRPARVAQQPQADRRPRSAPAAAPPASPALAWMQARLG